MKEILIGLTVALIILFVLTTIMFVTFISSDVQHTRKEHELQKKVNYYIKQLEDRER